jgi:AraC-like DNA-binding protein
MEFDTIQDVNRHLNCHYYQKEDNSVFEIIKHRKGVALSRESDNANLVIVISGEVRITSVKSGSFTACTDSLIILPAQEDIVFKFIKQSCLLSFFIPLDIDFCSRVRRTIFENTVETTAEEGRVLQANAFLQTYISLIYSSLEQKFLCANHINSQLQTLLAYICAFYPLPMLANFFAPMLNGTSSKIYDVNFKCAVLQNKNRFFKESEYAEAAKMSRTTFRRYFRRVFNENPKEWILSERNKLIENELKHSSKSLKNIAAIAGFKSVREFYAYCKKHLGRQATKIRKEHTQQIIN